MIERGREREGKGGREREGGREGRRKEGKEEGREGGREGGRKEIIKIRTEINEMEINDKTKS